MLYLINLILWVLRVYYKGYNGFDALQPGSGPFVLWSELLGNE